MLDVKHGLDDLVRLGGEELWADSTANKSNGLDSLSSELLVAWLWVFIKAAKEEINSLTKVIIELFLDNNCSRCKGGHGVLFLDRDSCLHQVCKNWRNSSNVWLNKLLSGTIHEIGDS